MNQILPKKPHALLSAWKHFPCQQQEGEQSQKVCGLECWIESQIAVSNQNTPNSAMQALGVRLSKSACLLEGRDGVVQQF